MGVTVNGLVNKDFTGLIILTIVYGIKILVDFIRRLIDTRVYAKVFYDEALDLQENQNNKEKTDFSQTTARLSMLEEVVDFVEEDLTLLFKTIISLVGSIIMLIAFNFVNIYICLISGLLIALIYAITGDEILNLNKKYNNELEKQVNIIKSKDKPKFKGHIQNLNSLKIKLSDRDAKNFGIIEFIVFLFIIGVLLLLVNSGNPITPGAILAVMTYAFNFADEVFMLPYVYQNYLRIYEILGRIKS
ncbi:MAG: ABC transporter six-transmembrane domain-containing protein [Candidatus Gracilibacteria bacterium]|nr:ABC transporter six-transmembrane domain-containing protein [Candidatus Gracilibacteria bacterium]